MLKKIFFSILIGLFLCLPAYANIAAGADKVFTIPGRYQTRIEWTGSNPIYVGVADPGLTAAQTGWLILKITWSGSTPTVIQTAVGIWDDRASIMYR